MADKDSGSIKILDLSEGDRPREKALDAGVGSLSDTELLAIIIGMGLPGFSAIDMARHIMKESENSLATIARMPVREMMRRFKGVGKAKAVSIAAALELGRRASALLDRKDEKVRTIRSSRDAYDYMRCEIQNLPYEEFWVILLTRANTIMTKRLISRGGTAATVVDTKLVMQEALSHLASGMILVHNHPSGNLRPSGEDDVLTRRLCEAAKILDMKVLDHLVIAAGGYYSYNDEGRL